MPGTPRGPSPRQRPRHRRPAPSSHRRAARCDLERRVCRRALGPSPWPAAPGARRPLLARCPRCRAWQRRTRPRPAGWHRLDGLERKIIGSASQLSNGRPANAAVPGRSGSRPASTLRVIESVDDRWPGEPTGSQTGSHPHPIPGYASRRRIRISAGQRPISLRQPTPSDVSAITRVQRPQYVSARTNDVEARKPGVGPADREGAAAAWGAGVVEAPGQAGGQAAQDLANSDSVR